MDEKSASPSVYSEKYALRSVDCGADGAMRLDAVFEVLQEAAGYHADLCGAGFMELLPAGRTWILSRMRVDLLRPMRYRDVIEVATWPRGVQGLLALRDFRITDAEGREAALGTSSWLLVEVATRRPLRVEEYLSERFRLTDDSVFGSDAVKLADFEVHPGANGASAFRVRPSDLDMNGHMTNTAYLKMLSDGLAESFPGFVPSSVTVNFLAEAFLGDELALQFDQPCAGERPSGERPSGERPSGAKLLPADGGKERVRFSLA